jgi:hypothetical protein
MMGTDGMIIAVDEEIARLQLVRRLLAGETVADRKATLGKVSKPRKATGKVKRVLSADARERIASAQRKRWAATRRSAKRAAKA